MGHGYVRGEVWLNPDSEWRITEVNECRYKVDKNGGRPAYCKVSETAVRFASGSGCRGCCACEDSGYVWVNVTVEKVEKPYVEWVKVEPETPEMLEEYTILVSVRNPSNEAMAVTLWCNETGLLEGYDDQLLIPPANKSQTLMIPPKDNVTFEFRYKHYWRWMKPLEILSGAEGGAGIIKNILGQIPEEELPEILTKTTKALKIIEYAAMLGAKPIAIYKYEINSPAISKPEEKHAFVFIHEAKVLSSVMMVIEGSTAGTFTTMGLTKVPDPRAKAIMVILEFLSFYVSDQFKNVAVNPDQNYMQPVFLQPITIPELDEYPNSPVKDMVEQYILLASEAKAFSEAWAKYLGAKMANDTEWGKRSCWQHITT